MKTVWRAGALLATCLCLASCSSTTVSPAGDTGSAQSGGNASSATGESENTSPKPFNSGGLLAGTATPHLPDGETGKVAVVQVGPLNKDDGTLVIAFRNNTSAPISHVDWSATARVGGSIVATGQSQGSIPGHVQPGEVGLSYIYFSTASSIGADAEYEFSADTSPTDPTPFNVAPFRVTEANVIGDAIVGGAVNETGALTNGPYQVQVFCFDGDKLVGRVSSYAEQSSQDIPDGGKISFTVDLLKKSCPSFAVGATGYFN